MRLTSEQRRKLKAAGIARHGAKHGSLAMGVRFGATPSSEPTMTPGIPFDTLSEYDKAVFKRTLWLSQHGNPQEASTAVGALNRALGLGSVGNTLTLALSGLPGWQLVEGVWKLLKFAGLLTEGEFGLDSDGTCATPGQTVDVGQVRAISSINFGIRDPLTGDQDYEVNGGTSISDVLGSAQETTTSTPGHMLYTVTLPASCSTVICVNGAVVRELGGCSGSGTSEPSCPGELVFPGPEFHSCGDAAYWIGTIKHGFEALPGDVCANSYTLEGTLNLGPDDEVSVGFRDPDGTLRCDVFEIPNTGFNWNQPPPALGDGGLGTIPDTGEPPFHEFDLDDTCDIIHALKCDPSMDPHLPDPGDYPQPSPPPPGSTPPGTIPPGTEPPGTIPPPGTEPPGTDPGIPTDPGTQPPITPGPTPDPIDPGPPPPGTPPVPEPPAIGEPPDFGNFDPGDGGCFDFQNDPPGFRDPSQPGGIGAPYQPGQCMEFDPGDGPVLRGQISRVTPSANGGSSKICMDPPIPPPAEPGDPTKQKVCYGSDTGDDPVTVVSVIQSILGDMTITRCGKATVIFDSDCDKVLTRKYCWPEGTPKKKILDFFLKMCGFCVFPQPDGNVIVGFCTPLNVHWTYHEDVDLIGFELEYDNKEVYAYVRCYVPDRYNRAGQIVEPGYEIILPTQTPIAVDPSSIYDVELPFGTPRATAMTIAVNTAAEMRNQALPLIHFAVPINTEIKQRHQIHIKRPSLGFNAVYMVTRIAQEYSSEAYLSTGLARWLHAETVTSPPIGAL